MLLPTQSRAVLCDHVVGRIISKEAIEIMEAPACGTKNQGLRHGYSSGEAGFLRRIISLVYALHTSGDRVRLGSEYFHWMGRGLAE